jgi:hypothetical protein
MGGFFSLFSSRRFPFGLFPPGTESQHSPGLAGEGDAPSRRDGAKETQ